MSLYFFLDKKKKERQARKVNIDKFGDTAIYNRLNNINTMKTTKE